MWDLPENNLVQLVNFFKTNDISTPVYLSALFKKGKRLMVLLHSILFDDCSKTYRNIYNGALAELVRTFLKEGALVQWVSACDDGRVWLWHAKWTAFHFNIQEEVAFSAGSLMIWDHSLHDWMILLVQGNINDQRDEV